MEKTRAFVRSKRILYALNAVCKYIYFVNAYTCVRTHFTYHQYVYTMYLYSEKYIFTLIDTYIHA